tara:strand:+ start:312 stop:506 length:195 start_codon:yes stop_codon:yes gene_type:complete
MEIGSIVRITDRYDAREIWPEAVGQVGVVIAMAQRLFVPAAKVMVLGAVAEFDLDELEVIDAEV